jgi:8-oxo-dGTP pyrophosphatase MutT (NUDIX family)
MSEALPLADETDPAIPAATVVLVRDGAAGLETLMLKRDSRLAFAGGAWVFPGGRIDAEDFPGGVRPTDADPDPATMLEAARTAAVREALEEAGLAVDRDSLVWFAHWTPAHASPRRFATWFFLAPAPEGTVVIDDGEIREHEWIHPRDAVARRDAGEVELVPPTYVTLHELADYDSVAAAIAGLDSGTPPFFVTRIARVEGGLVSLWQGDAGYDTLDPDVPGPRNRLLMLDTGWVLDRS